MTLVDVNKLAIGSPVDSTLLDWWPPSFEENRLRKDLPSVILFEFFLLFFFFLWISRSEQCSGDQFS